MKKIILTICLCILLFPASTQSDVSEWVLGEPTLDSDDYEWILGGPSVEIDNTAGAPAAAGQVIMINMW